MRKFINKVYQYFLYRITLKSKFLITHLLLALVPAIVIASFSYQKFSSIITYNTTQSLEVISEQTASSIESMFAQVSSVMDAITDQDFLISFLQNTDMSSYRISSSFPDDLTSFINSTNYLKDGHMVSDIHIYLDEKHYNIVDPYQNGDMFLPLSMSKGTYWHGIYSTYSGNSLVCPSMYLSPSEIENYGDMAIINRVWLPGNSEAYIAVYFSKESINDILLQDIPFTDSVIYILNERESIVSTTNTTLSGTYYLDYQSIPSSIRTTKRFVNLNFAGEAVYVGYKTISGTDWYMVTAIPVKNVVSEGNSLLLEFIFLYTGFVIISAFFSILLSNSIIRRLSSIIHQMKTVRLGPPARLEAPESTDEIGELVDTYNYMSDEINNLIDEQTKAAEELRLSEFRALQSQINPHFLYNTLDMINWLAQSGKSDEVSEAVQFLSRFYKLTLNKGNNVVRIRDEIEHAGLYMELQNMRYNHKIQFLVDVPEDLLDYSIPKLVFQPIVENSLLHGILEKESKEGTIIIMGWREEDSLVFVVSDDGVGIEPEKLSTILDGSGKSETGSNVGIYNTHRRLQLYYNSDSGLIYRSIPNVQTEVEIRIPAEPFSTK